MGRQQHGSPIAGDLADEFVDVLPRDRVEAGRRFIQKDQPWPPNQRLGKAETLEHTFRISTDSPFGCIRKTDPVEQRQGGGRAFPLESCIEGQHLLAGERGREGDRFRQVGRTGAGSVTAGNSSQHRDVAAVAFQKSQHNLEQRRLAGAIVTEQRDPFARIERKGDIVDGLQT